MNQQNSNMHHITRSQLILFLLASIITAASTTATGANVSSTQSTQVQMQQQMARQSSGPSKIACSIREVGVLGNRIHILCTNSWGNIRYFAASSKDISSDRYVALAAAAKSRNQKINIHFDSRGSANPAGCLVKDCRKITAMFW